MQNNSYNTEFNSCISIVSKFASVTNLLCDLQNCSPIILQ